MQEEPTQPYNACPYCLTSVDGKPAETNPVPPKLEQKIEQLQEKLKNITIEQKPHSCRFHLGYLSERSQKEDYSRKNDCI